MTPAEKRAAALTTARIRLRSTKDRPGIDSEALDNLCEVLLAAEEREGRLMHFAWRLARVSTHEHHNSGDFQRVRELADSEPKP